MFSRSNDCLVLKFYILEFGKPFKPPLVNIRVNIFNSAVTLRWPLSSFIKRKNCRTISLRILRLREYVSRSRRYVNTIIEVYIIKKYTSSSFMVYALFIRVQIGTTISFIEFRRAYCDLMCMQKNLLVSIGGGGREKFFAY